MLGAQDEKAPVLMALFAVCFPFLLYQLELVTAQGTLLLKGALTR
jgi:hypothetical protein